MKKKTKRRRKGILVSLKALEDINAVALPMYFE